MGLKIKREDTEEFKVTLVEQSFEEEPSIYDLQYLVYRLDLQKQFSLSDLETKIISFILSYKSVSNRFYFGNGSLAKLFDKSERSISRSIGILEEKCLIKTSHTIMAGGGEIRFISIDENLSQGWTKTASEDGHECLENNNKINNNKINTISKDIGDKPAKVDKSINSDTLFLNKTDDTLKRRKEYGNSGINECIGYLGGKLGASLDGSVKENRQYCYLLLNKMKKDYPEVNEVDSVKMLIDTAMQDRFHSKNTTGFKYLFYNVQRIAQSFKSDYGMGDKSDIQVI